MYWRTHSHTHTHWKQVLARIRGMTARRRIGETRKCLRGREILGCIYKEIIMKHPLYCFVTWRNYFIYLRIYYFKHKHTHTFIYIICAAIYFFIHCLIVRDVGRRISPRIDRTREIEHTAMTWLYYVYNTHTLYIPEWYKKFLVGTYIHIDSSGIPSLHTQHTSTHI